MFCLLAMYMQAPTFRHSTPTSPFILAQKSRSEHIHFQIKHYTRYFVYICQTSGENKETNFDYLYNYLFYQQMPLRVLEIWGLGIGDWRLGKIIHWSLVTEK
jgi:hypothetical protein